MTEKIRVRITGPCEVAGVKPGGFVDLDPSVTNIRALETAGHVRAAPMKAVKADKPEKAEKAPSF
ncbi:hypothetical protein [Microbispora bryophytorum]|uniref:hypothetical protein n=1 Tax=Microbispora bryophytorum TaxID=1460882 RepID=UPI0033CF679B